MDRSAYKLGLRLSAVAINSTHQFVGIREFVADRGTLTISVPTELTDTSAGGGLTLYAAWGSINLDLGVARLWGSRHTAFHTRAMLGLALPVGASGEVRIRTGYRHESNVLFQTANHIPFSNSGIAIEFELVANIGLRGGVTLTTGGYVYSNDRAIQPMIAAGGEYAFIGDNRYPLQEGDIAVNRAKLALTKLDRLSDINFVPSVAGKYKILPEQFARQVYTINNLLEYLLYPSTAWEVAELASFNSLYHEVRSAAGYAYSYGLSEHKLSAMELVVAIGENDSQQLKDALTIKIARMLSRYTPQFIEQYKQWAAQVLENSRSQSMNSPLLLRLDKQKRRLESLSATISKFQEKFVVASVSLHAFHSAIRCMLSGDNDCPPQLNGVSLQELEAKIKPQNETNDLNQWQGE